MRKKPIPVGYEDFKSIIDNGYYYVDKTMLIQELLEYRGHVNLFTRPRRFGKTLNISMLRYFFEKSDIDHVDLFQGLKVMKHPECLKHMGKYPVISITLKSGKQSTPDLVKKSIGKSIAEEFRRHADILSMDFQRNRIERILNAEGDESDYIDALRLLSECLYRSFNQKVIILIDEYDVPLEHGYFRGFYEEILDFIRSLFESALKTNPYMEFAMVTGCLRISKESIFTGLNNLETISINNRLYAEHFGFTEQEVDDMLVYYQLEDRIQTVKEWYNGYLFGDTEVYNPWSVVNFVKTAGIDRKATPNPYWSNTSSNNIVRQLIERSDATVRQEIEQLLDGGSIEKQIYEDMTYEDVEKSKDSLWNFLYFTGYLKNSGEHTENSLRYMTLTIPNLEVRQIYETKILDWFNDKIHKRDSTALYQGIIKGDAEKVQDELNAVLRQTISFYDGKEAFYHGFLLGILNGMEDYVLTSNREAGDGRYDIMLRNPDIEEPAIIFELKVVNKLSELEQKAGEALRQIMDKQYDDPLKSEGYQSMIHFGISFYRKNCYVLCENQSF